MWYRIAVGINIDIWYLYTDKVVAVIKPRGHEVSEFAKFLMNG